MCSVVYTNEKSQDYDFSFKIVDSLNLQLHVLTHFLHSENVMQRTAVFNTVHDMSEEYGSLRG